jgi:hypothetical protein
MTSEVKQREHSGNHEATGLHGFLPKESQDLWDEMMKVNASDKNGEDPKDPANDTTPKLDYEPPL